MKRLIITTFAANIAMLAMPNIGFSGEIVSVDLGNTPLTESEKKVAQTINIQESGNIDASVKGKNIALLFYDGKKRGDVSTKFIKEFLLSKGIKSNGGFMPKSFHIKAYTHVYSDDKTSYDSGSTMITDIEPDHLVMSETHVSEKMLRANNDKDLFKLDAGVIHEGTKMTQAMGSSAGVWGGVGANIVANLARKLVNTFTQEKVSDVALDSNVQNTNANADVCGNGCKVTHHVVVFNIVYDSDVNHYYTLALDKVDDKVYPEHLTILANQGLQTVAEKIAQAVVSN